MQRIVRVCTLMSLAWLLIGCPATSVRPPPESKEALPTVGAPDLRGAAIYAIDSNASDVQVHVFRGGTLARLGHNHVMTSKHLTGRVWLQKAVDGSGFEMSFPVAELIVDDARARAAAGAEFPGEIPENDRIGTKKNMLRAEVLDAEHFPTIALRSVRVSGTLANAQVIARITIKEVSQDVAVPTVVTMNGQQLKAAGEFDIQQTAFGIKPFSIGLGALEVVDRLHIKFNVVAEQR